MAGAGSRRRAPRREGAGMTLESPLLYEKKPGRLSLVRDGRLYASLNLSRKVGLPALLAVVAIIAWELVVDWMHIPTVILAPPSEIVAKIVKFYPLLLENAVPTTVES